MEGLRLLPETYRLLFSKLEERPKENIQSETWEKNKERKYTLEVKEIETVEKAY